MTVGRKQADWREKLELLVFQPTPFCNLDCDYCYLPDRNNRCRMDTAVVEATARKVFDSGLPATNLSVVWHAGEPLMVPSNWYEAALSLFKRYERSEVTVTHHMQTNGVLIDDAWCAFFVRHGIRVGISIDGPAWLHDIHRRTRSGKGTHDRVMRGIEILRRNHIDFHTICVLTRDSLPHADALLDFFETLGPSNLSFNVDEVEAANKKSTLIGNTSVRDAVESAFRDFFTRLISRIREGSLTIPVREVGSILGALRHPAFGTFSRNSQNDAGRIVSVAWDGRFHTFSPELVGTAHPRLGDLALGNVLFDPLPPSSDDARLVGQEAEVSAGVENCRRVCKYFSLCLGGAPSNKLGETGRLDSAETNFCRLTQKVVADVVLEALEEDLSGQGAKANFAARMSRPDGPFK